MQYVLKSARISENIRIASASKSIFKYHFIFLRFKKG